MDDINKALKELHDELRDLRIGLMDANDKLEDIIKSL